MNATILSTLFSLYGFAPWLLTAQPPHEWGWRMHALWSGGWGMGMMLMMLLFWGALLVALILGIRWLIGQSKVAAEDSALSLLRDRFARGEIEKDEFESRKKTLT